MTDIVSPLPGTFYMRPSPDADPFMNTGDTVADGDVIGLIEVMKTFIEIKAEVSGTFAGYRVDDATSVKPGQPVAQVE